MNNENLFDFAVSCGILDASELKSLYDNMESEKYLQQHFGKGYELTKGRDGRYFTRLPDGKQVRTADKNKFIQEIKNYYLKKDAKKISVPVKERKVGIEQVFENWITFKSSYENITKATVDRTRKDFQRFFINNPLADQLMRCEFRDIDENELELFVRGTIRDLKLNTKSWTKFRALLNGIWLYGLKIKHTEIYITKFIDMLAIKPKMLQPHYQNEEEQVFTDEEARRVLDEINSRKFSLQNYGIILGFYTGMRIGEIAALKWSDISKDLSKLSVNHMEILYEGEDGVKNCYEIVDHAKTQAGLRQIIIPNELIPYLKELKEYSGDKEFVFTEKNGRRLHARSFSDKLNRLCKQLSLTPRRMHKVRKTVCSKMCDCGVDDRLLLTQIGHTDRKTTETFYHRDRRSDNEKRLILNEALRY